MHNMSSIGPASEQDEPEPDSPSEYKPLPAACFGIDVVCDDARWHPHIAYIQAGLGELGVVLGLPSHGEVSVRLTDDAQIADLNISYRDKTGATNVLSFPAHDFVVHAGPTDDRTNDTGRFPDVPFALGDIVLAFDTLAREAAAADKPFTSHLAHLLTHGLLHLLGYDHENDTDAARMEAKETALLVDAGLDDPYGDTQPMPITDPDTRGPAHE